MDIPNDFNAGINSLLVAEIIGTSKSAPIALRITFGLNGSSGASARTTASTPAAHAVRGVQRELQHLSGSAATLRWDLGV